MIDLSTRRQVLGLAPALTFMPFILPDQSWSAPMNDTVVRPFRIQISDEVLGRISRRVADAHFPVTSQGAGWQYGVDAQWFRALVSYWRNAFDWRNVEAELNRTPQFVCMIDGKPIHFAHLKPSASASRGAILLLHGWPYTFATMLPLADLLVRDGFEVVVPSLPGYGLSPAPDESVRGLHFISRRIDKLMSVLGHQHYILHGSDHGAVIADWIALDSPERVRGYHAHMIGFRHAGAEYGSGKTGVPDASPEEEAYARAEVENMDKESAYFRLQLTRPETITYALTDSPIGWAAYMLDKWQKWSDTRTRRFEEIYSRDRLLMEVMLFLVTDTVATSIWPYAGFAAEPFGLAPGQYFQVPFGFSSFPDPLLPRMPRKFAARARRDIRLWREHTTGGHFPMLECTEDLARDIHDFAATL
jgi:pimeloyl-ACP methyl ester carboxylesterase